MIREHKNARVAHSAPESSATLDAAHMAPPASRGPALRVRLIGKSNGVGLTRDFELLSRALQACGCEVSMHGCERRERKARRGLLPRWAARLRQRSRRAGRSPRAPRPWDVNVMLEHVWPQFLHQAHCNVLVPNPEWFDRRDVAFLDAIDRVWAKTELATELFSARGCGTSHLGFDSEDRWRPEVARERAFLHLAGRSPLKGTERLLALWRDHPEWPRLTVVQDGLEREPPAAAAANLTLLRGYLEDAELRRLQNAHRFHLCLSEAEGWGHYIAEAMSVAAVTFASDAPPMNELIHPERGVLVSVQLAERHNLVPLARFEERSLEAQLAHALRLPAAELEALGAAARSWFLANKQGFAARVQAALNDLDALARGTTRRGARR